MEFTPSTISDRNTHSNGTTVIIDFVALSLTQDSPPANQRHPNSAVHCIFLPEQKRYSMEEVLQDASWLDKQWAEKDRLLDYFARHNTFPVDRRGFCRLRVFESRMQSMETSIVSLVRLLLLPCAVPVLLFLSIPILWTTFWAWLFYRGYQYVMDVETTTTASPAATARDDHDGPAHGTSSQGGTPFTPATPFASPSISTWFR